MTLSAPPQRDAEVIKVCRNGAETIMLLSLNTTVASSHSE